MANVKIALQFAAFDGQPLTFKAPCDCAHVTGIKVEYPNGEDTAFQVFTFADAHGNDVGDLDNLFAEGSMVKVILDTDTNRAFIQNADTNAYLERKFDSLGIESAEYPGCFYRLAGEETEWINPPMVAGVEYRTAKRHNGSAVYTKLFNVETLKTASVAMGIQGRVISFHGNAFHHSGSIDPFPMFDGAGSLMAIAYIAQGSIQIRAFNDKDISNYSASFTVEYTK